MSPTQFKKAMDKLDYNSYEMAEALGVGYVAITRYLAGTRKISKMCEILVNLLVQGIAKGK